MGPDNEDCLSLVAVLVHKLGGSVKITRADTLAPMGKMVTIAPDTTDDTMVVSLTDVPGETQQ
jgi:hypothetical protein